MQTASISTLFWLRLYWSFVKMQLGAGKRGKVSMSSGFPWLIKQLIRKLTPPELEKDCHAILAFIWLQTLYLAE